ncbi:unnamed protein product, partial [Prorocentrum cordatum]
ADDYELDRLAERDEAYAKQQAAAQAARDVLDGADAKCRACVKELAGLAANLLPLWPNPNLDGVEFVEPEREVKPAELV